MFFLILFCVQALVCVCVFAHKNKISHETQHKNINICIFYLVGLIAAGQAKINF